MRRYAKYMFTNLQPFSCFYRPWHIRYLFSDIIIMYYWFIFLAHRSWRLTRWAYSIARLCRPPSSVVHTFEQLYLQEQLANFSHILSVASLGWGKDCIRFWGRLDHNCGYHGNRKFPLTYNGQNGVPAFSQSPLIGSVSNLQVTRTGIKSRMSSNLGRVGFFTTELFALERSHWLWMGKMVTPSFLSCYDFNHHQTYMKRG